MKELTLYLRIDEQFIGNVTNIRRWLTPEEERKNDELRIGFGVPNGILYRFRFDNGYGASVVKHAGTYGFDDDLWEVAVLHNDRLCYDTPVTCDVEGYCNDKEVNRILKFLKEYDGNENKEFEFRDEFLNQEDEES